MDRFGMSVLLVVIAAGPRAAAQTVPAPQPGASMTVSVDELRRPLSSKALRWLLIAQEYGRLGEHPRAIHLLQETLDKEPSRSPTFTACWVSNT